MLYFANPSTLRIRDTMNMNSQQLGAIITPAQGNPIPPNVRWCADNGCFGAGYPGDDAYIAWLTGLASRASNCQFAVAPDVPFNMEATLSRSAPMLPRIRMTGYRVALAVQNGANRLPWDDFDAIFIGGDTRWKLGPEARQLAIEAHARGKWVHMGRVNSLRRLQYASHIGCNSVDGTYLIYGPDLNLPRLLRYLRTVNGQTVLWDVL